MDETLLENSDSHNHRAPPQSEDHNHNHGLCQKYKAENEIFLETTRERFIKTVNSWKLESSSESNLRSEIIEIIELILNEPLSNSIIDTSRAGILKYESSYCNEIHLQNEFHKIQFFKVSYFLECLERSKISMVHLHRIKQFLETKLFNHLSLKDFFFEMTSLEHLYECKMCNMMAPVDAGLDDISKVFYVSVRNRCKECFRKESAYRYEVKKKEKKSEKIALGVPMTKIYLCMKCGEDNYINFYERNKSKCKFCILAEKRGVIVSGEGVGTSASKSWHCNECHNEEPKNFRETYKSLCYACFLEKKKDKYKEKKLKDGTELGKKLKEYFCKDCETDEPGRFRRGYKSQCYTCFLKEKNIERLKENKDKSLGIGVEERKVLDKVSDLTSSIFEDVLCKYCNDKNPKNFNEGMQTLCARCETIEMETYICTKCNSECLRNCMNLEKGLCNLCDPEAFKSEERKPHKCTVCNESKAENFYSGFKSKCKVCTRNERRQLYETRERMLKQFLCSECGEKEPSKFHLGHKSKCKSCM